MAYLKNVQLPVSRKRYESETEPEKGADQPPSARDGTLSLYLKEAPLRLPLQGYHTLPLKGKL